MIAYSERQYHHFDQERTLQQKEHQHRVVEDLSQRNINTLNIQMTSKTKVMYEPSKRKRVDLGQGQYCYITDNSLNKRHTVLTLHGAPGDHVEWAGLEQEMGECCRWINFTFPGFDGEDERRGTYTGSAEGVCQLLINLLKKLQISKVILCAHSMGSIFSSYLITNYPQIVSGYINITGIVDHWYVGLMTFFRSAIAEHELNDEEWRRRKLYDDDNYRAILHNKFLSLIYDKTFGPVDFPRLTKSQYFAYIKLINTFPKGLSELYNLNKILPIFRVLIFGKKDPLHDWQTTQASIYNLCKGNSYLTLPYYQKLFSVAKNEIEERLLKEFGVSLDGSKLQQYFCFHLQDTGHNAHKRRPKEMSHILKIYFVCIEVLEKYQETIKSNL